MNKELMDAIKDEKWSSLTKSEAMYFIKKGLVSQVFNMTPYVKSKLYLKNKAANKCDFIIYGPALNHNYQNVVHSSHDKNGVYKKSFVSRIKLYDRTYAGVVPVIRIDENVNLDWDSLGELDVSINERIIKYGRYMYERISEHNAITLENAYQEYSKNYKSIYKHPGFFDSAYYEEFAYKGEVYGRYELFSSHEWVKMKDLEWIVDSKHKILVCRNIIDIFDTNSKFYSMREQSTRGKVDVIISGEYKGIPKAKEYKVVDKENIMSQIIKNKYGIDSEETIKRELKR